MIKIILLMTLSFSVFATTKIKDNTLKIGKSDSNDVLIFANNGNANLPYIVFDYAQGRWLFSNNGTSNINFDNEVTSLTLDDDDQITLSTSANNQIITVVGNGAAITMNVLPFDNTPKDTSKIILMGSDDTNTVKFTYNDVINGLLLNGDATLLKGYAITLIYNQSLSRFVEISRNF